MATLSMVMTALQKTVSSVTQGLLIFGAPVVVEVGKEWPPVKTIQQSVKMRPPRALVTVFDRKHSVNTTRWIPSTSVISTPTTQLASSPTSQILLPGLSGSVTLSGQITAGDAVSLILRNRLAMSKDVADGTTITEPVLSAVASAGMDLSSTADALAAAGTEDLSSLATVTAAGSVVTVTNVSPGALTLLSYTGNVGTRTMEIGRRTRDMQVVIWAPNPEIRDTVMDPVSAAVSMMEVDLPPYIGGLALPDGTLGRVRSVNDFLVEDAMLSDVYRRDLILTVEHGVTVQDQLWSVLVPLVSSYSITA